MDEWPLPLSLLTRPRFLDVDVDELTGTLALVAVRGLEGIEEAKPIEAVRKAPPRQSRGPRQRLSDLLGGETDSLCEPETRWNVCS